MKKIALLAAMFIVAATTVAIAAPVYADDPIKETGNVGFVAFVSNTFEDVNPTGWVKCTLEADALVSSWHVYGLVPGTTYDLYAEIGAPERILVAEGVVAEATYDDETGTWSNLGSISGGEFEQFSTEIGESGFAYVVVFKIIGVDVEGEAATQDVTVTIN